MNNAEKQNLIDGYFSDENLSDNELNTFKELLKNDETFRKDVFGEYLLRKSLAQRSMDEITSEINAPRNETEFENFKLDLEDARTEQQHSVVKKLLLLVLSVLLLIVFILWLS